MSVLRMSRRSFVRQITIVGSAVAAIPILAACGGSAAAPAATIAAAPPKPASAPAATTAPVAAAAPTAAPATTGDFNVWFNPNWNETTNAAVGNVFVKWGKEKGINATYQLNSGGPADKAKLTAALQAGQPPDIDQDAAGAYWWKLVARQS
jgi:hypothetical protein